MCGGTLWGYGAAGAASGLSPRVRGNQQVVAPAEQQAGSIPACAGEPWGPRIVTGIITVYPRVCGGTKSLSGE